MTRITSFVLLLFLLHILHFIHASVVNMVFATPYSPISLLYCYCYYVFASNLLISRVGPLTRTENKKRRKNTKTELVTWPISCATTAATNEIHSCVNQRLCVHREKFFILSHSAFNPVNIISSQIHMSRTDGSYNTQFSFPLSHSHSSYTCISICMQICTLRTIFSATAAASRRMDSHICGACSATYMHACIFIDRV